MVISDLHIHSRFSRATSKEGDPEHLDLWARKKGIHIIGTGDFTHPSWREELKEKLEPAEEGLYKLKKEYRIQEEGVPDTMEPRFAVTGEISSIYKKGDKVRKVHSLLLLPGLEEADMLSARLELIGNLHSDGRPILGLYCRDLLEIMLETVPEGIYVPAHIWTPHFAMFGAFSGFDSVEECFEDLTPYVHAVETGLSSDPPMNWRVSNLDRYQLISNSDAHSPAKLGREANLMEIELSYDNLKKAVETGEGLYGTIEFFPEEGKYHYDGHRKCHLCLTPAQTKAYGGKCPVCGRKLTIGVEHRIEALADRPEGYEKQNRKPFENLMPLPEVLAEATGHSAASMKVQKEYRNMLENLGAEFEILREVPIEDIQKAAGTRIAEGIRRLRNGEVERHPGFDGEYGTISLFRKQELEDTEGQLDFFSSLGISHEGKAEEALKMLLSGKKQLSEEKAQGQEKGNARKENMQRENKNSAQKGQVEILNIKQQEAVEALERTMAVIAGPGTGKTKTLISRIQYLMERRKVKPSEITAVTFTNKAALEMRQRLQRQLGSRRSLKNMHIGTFHEICIELLQKQGLEFTIADEMQTRELAEELIGEYGLNLNVKQFQSSLSLIKNRQEHRIPKGESLPEACVRQYQDRLGSLKALDFDDILTETIRLLKDNPKVKGKSFSYLFVDEFQDINPVQYELMELWNQGGRELFVIGDPEQSIYGFRGSDAACFENLQKDYPETRVIRLEENYRSVSSVVDSALAVISQNPGQERKLHAVKRDGEKVRIVEASGEMAQAIFAAKEINRQIGGIDMLDIENSFERETERRQRRFSDIAILYRTHHQARLLEKCLKQEGIPYVIAGRDEFLDSLEVQGCISFFRSILNPKDLLARREALKLLWDLPENAVTSQVYEIQRETYEPLLKRTKPHKLIQRWRKEMRQEEDAAMDCLERMAILHKNMGELLETLSTGQESDILCCSGKSYASDAVTLMTMHGAKGLEFPVVLLLGAQEGKVPLESATYETDRQEERRLFYVGMTRAKEELILTYADKPSPFLADIPEACIRKERAGKAAKEKQGEQMSLFEFL